MATYTPDGILIDEVTITQQRVPVAPDIPEVTVVGRFDWQFWLGIAAAAGALYLVFVSGRQAKRLPTRRRVSRRLR